MSLDTIPTANPIMVTRAVLRGFGIDPDKIRWQKVVLEMDGSCIPKLYVRCIGLPLTDERVAEIEAAIVKFVDDVEVTDKCEVVIK